MLRVCVINTNRMSEWSLLIFNLIDFTIMFQYICLKSKIFRFKVQLLDEVINANFVDSFAILISSNDVIPDEKCNQVELM